MSSLLDDFSIFSLEQKMRSEQSEPVDKTVSNFLLEYWKQVRPDKIERASKNHEAKQATGSLSAAPLTPAAFASLLAPGTTDFVPFAPDMPLKEAVKASEEIYARSTSVIKDFLQASHSGKEIKLDPITGVIDSVVDCVTHNHNALLVMRSLRSADAYTFYHCINVSALAVVFGKSLGCDEEQLRCLGLCGFLHDVGKQFIPLGILNAPRKLSKDEFRIIQEHPTIGFQQIMANPVIPEVAKMGILEHHEKADGSGYPFGKRGDEISPMARIITVVDVYDALASNRPYKTALPLYKVVSILYSMRETAFAPLMAERFIRCLGIYPVGSLVKLSTGNLAIVSDSHQENLLQPQLLVLPHQKPTKGTDFQRVELADVPDVQIVKCLDPQQYKIDCQHLLRLAAKEGIL